MSSDYCTWDGVSCEHKTGDVIGLDLSCSQLEGAILPNSTFFQLSHLRSLNLSGNNFSLSNQFPREFGFFAKGLMHLNLSDTRFSGSVPSGISHLYKLVSLDLSDNYRAKLEDEVFKSLLQNLTQLRVLNLAWVNIFSVLPVNFSTSLRVLNLEGTGVHGVVPQEVFHLPNLELLALFAFDLSDDLTVRLPKVKWGSSASLQHLYLENINIDGGIPDSIGFLESLDTLRLFSCNLSGQIPRSIGHLQQLTYLGLMNNNLNGSFPIFLANLTNLRLLALGVNNFTGSLPRWLFHHPSLETLSLGYNGFTGQLHEFDSSRLQFFDCRYNSLNGPIPQSFSQLLNLTYLVFSSNNFTGVLDLGMFSGLEHLVLLDLSHNSLSVRSTHIYGHTPSLHCPRILGPPGNFNDPGHCPRISAAQLSTLHSPAMLLVGPNSIGILKPSSSKMSKKSRLLNWFNAYSANVFGGAPQYMCATKGHHNLQFGKNLDRKHQSCNQFDPKYEPFWCQE